MSLKKIDKKSILDLLVVLGITIFSLAYLYSDKIIVGDDLTYHLNRFQGLANAFEEGQILPKIYPYANYGYGYASPLFYCDLFLYPFAILYHFGVSAVLCYKYCVFFYTLLGNLLIYFIFKKETNNRLLTLIAAVLYSCTNYHIQNIYVRAALGEILAMTFIPFVIHSIYRVLVKNEDAWAYLGVSFSCLLMCHLISTFLYALFFLIMIIIYIVLNRKDINLVKKTLITIIKGTLLALLLTAWYLFPMLEQLQSQTFWLSINTQYNNIDAGTQTIKDLVTNVFALTDWKNFKIANGASVGPILLLFPMCNIFAKRNKYITIISIYSLVLFLILIGVVPGEYLNVMQFYFRLYIVIFPLLIIVSIYFLANINKTVIKNAICIIICVYSVANIYLALEQTKNGKYYLANDADIYTINSIQSHLYSNLDYNHDELGGCEYLPYTERVKYAEDTAIKFKDEYGVFVEYYPGYYVSDMKKYFSTGEFSTENVKDGTELLIPISYYKGYSAYILNDGEWQQTEISYDEETKRLVVYAKDGNQTYKVTYTGTIVQKASLIISLLTIVGFVCFEITKKYKKEKHDA